VDRRPTSCQLLGGAQAALRVREAGGRRLIVPPEIGRARKGASQCNHVIQHMMIRHRVIPYAVIPDWLT
jgi:hypothetical protein